MDDTHSTAQLFAFHTVNHTYQTKMPPVQPFRTEIYCTLLTLKMCKPGYKQLYTSWYIQLSHLLCYGQIYGQVQNFCLIVDSITRLLNGHIHLTGNYHAGNTNYHLYGYSSGSDIGKPYQFTRFSAYKLCN